MPATYEYATVSGSERWSSTASNGAEKSPVSKLKRLWSLPIVPAMKARYYPDTDSLYVEVRGGRRAARPYHRDGSIQTNINYYSTTPPGATQGQLKV